MEELRVVITADASTVAPGVAQATAAVQASADSIATAQQTATAATKALAAAQAKLGAAAAAGNAQAASIISEYAQASAQATAALEAMTTAQVENTAATVAGTAAQERDTAVTYNRMEAMGAARVAMGAMDGSVGMMAGGLARLAAGSSTLGPILAGLVPYAAIAAGVFILADLVKGIDKFATDAEDLANELNTDWLTGAIGQMNGLKDAIEQTDKATLQYQKDVDSDSEKLRTAQIENIRLTDGQAAAYRAMAEDKRKALGATQSALANDLDEQRRLTVASQFGARPDLSPGEENKQRLIAVQQLASITEKIKDDNVAIAALSQEAANYDKQAADVKTPKGAAAPRENYEQEAAALKLQGKNLGEILLFWERINKDGEHNTEVLRAQEELLKDINAQGKLRAEPAPGPEPAQITDTSGLAGGLTTKEIADQADAALEREIAEKQRIFEINERGITEEERYGILTIGNAEKAALALQRQAQAAEEAAIKQRMLAVDPSGLGAGALYGEQLREYQKLQQQMDQVARKGAEDRLRIEDQATQKLEQMYQKVANTFNQDFERAFNSWITGSKTAGQAFAQMLGQMELQVVDFVAKWILEQIEMWAIQEILQATGLSVGKDKQAAANTATVISDASTAAATAAAAAAAGGPPAMLAAAAIASGIVLAVGSAATFDAGGMLPHMGYAFNSSGSIERVLSPSQTQNFESLVNNGGSSRSATLNQTNNFGGGVTPEMLDAHTSKTMSQLRAMIRPEAFR